MRKSALALALSALFSAAFPQNFLIDFSSDFSGRIFIDGEAKARVKRGETKRVSAKSADAKIALKLDDGFETSRRVKLGAGANKIRVARSDRYWKGVAAADGGLSGLCGISSKFAAGDVVEVQTAAGGEIRVKIVEKKALDDEKIILLPQDALFALKLADGGEVAVRKIFLWE